MKTERSKALREVHQEWQRRRATRENATPLQIAASDADFAVHLSGKIVEAESAPFEAGQGLLRSLTHFIEMVEARNDEPEGAVHPVMQDVVDTIIPRKDVSEEASKGLAALAEKEFDLLARYANPNTLDVKDDIPLMARMFDRILFVSPSGKKRSPSVRVKILEHLKQYQLEYIIRAAVAFEDGDVETRISPGPYERYFYAMVKKKAAKGHMGDEKQLETDQAKQDRSDNVDNGSAENEQGPGNPVAETGKIGEGDFHTARETLGRVSPMQSPTEKR